MLKLSNNAIHMLVSKYRAVLKQMLVKNTAAFAACCVMFGAPVTVSAADITYSGDAAALQTATIGGATSPSLIAPGASDNTVTVDFTAGATPYRIFGGLSDTLAVTGNTVSLINGSITNSLYGGYDAAAVNGAGAVGNTVTISSGTIGGHAIAGMSLSGAVGGNSLTMTSGSVAGYLFGGNSNGAGAVSGNSVTMSNGTAEYIYGGNSLTGTVSGNSVTMSGGRVNQQLFGGNSNQGNAENNSVVISGTAQIGDSVYGGVSYENGTASGNRVFMSDGTVGKDIFGGNSDSNATDGSGGAIANLVTLTGGSVARNVYGGYDWGTMGSGSAVNNQVTLAGAAVTGSVLGGAASNGLASGNTINMTSGSAGGQLVGGQSLGAGNEANDNRVTLSSGTVGTFVIGGLSDAGAASGNIVEVSGGTVTNSVFSGRVNSGSGTTQGNRVIVSGSADILDHAVGGLNSVGSSVDNTVELTGGHVGTNVTGGESTNGNVVNNTVVIAGSAQIDGYVRGGWTDTGNATGNSVTMTGGTVDKNIFGGISVSADATDNKVVITGGTFDSNTYVVGAAANNSGNSLRNSVTVTGGVMKTVTGGEAWGTGNVEGNLVIISGAAEAAFVHGGYASNSGDATGNSVVLEGGLVTSEVIGGFSHSGSANNNRVLVSGTAKVGDVLGGVAGMGGTMGDATGNSVVLDSGLVSGKVVGGSSDSGSANNNTVTLGRDVRLASTSSVFGGKGVISSGNTLNVNGFTGTLKEVNSFQQYNFLLPASLQSGVTVLTVATPTDLTGTQVAITGIEGGTRLAAGDTVTLISSTQGTPDSYSASNIRSGIALLYDFDVEAGGTALTATVTSSKLNPQTKALAEGYAANMAFVNQGADLAGGTGMADAMAKAKAAKGDIASFGAVAGGSSRYKTGSHADVDGTSLMTGVVTKREIEKGALVKGLFLEAGWGNYDTYNSFAGMSSVNGGGDTSYYGLGALIRQDRPDGGYVEGSARGGESRTTFGSGDLNNVSYTTNSGYYGVHIGIGKLKTEGSQTLDYYAKYFWTHQNGSTVRAGGDIFNFSGVDSSRLRGGLRLSQARPDGKSTSYVGLAYEYEFDGKACGSVYGMAMEAPSLKGGTGIVELGMSFKSRPESSNTLELGLQGYAGKREGVTGTVQLKRVF